MPETRIVEYKGKNFAVCPKCNRMVEIKGVFDPDMPCPTVEVLTVKFGDKEETRKIACDGKLNFRPLSKMWGGRVWTFESKDEVLGVPAHGRRVAVIEDVGPQDNNIQFFDDNLVKAKTNNDWFWATDLEQMVTDKDALGTFERHLVFLKDLFGVDKLEKRVSSLERLVERIQKKAGVSDNKTDEKG